MPWAKGKGFETTRPILNTDTLIFWAIKPAFHRTFAVSEYKTCA